jgi:hypothetical protein
MLLLQWLWGLCRKKIPWLFSIQVFWLFKYINHRCYTSSPLTASFNNLAYILESNPHPFYSCRGLKMQKRSRIECGLDSRSRAGFWPNDRASVRAVQTIQGGKNEVRIRFENIRYFSFLFIYSRNDSLTSRHIKQKSNAKCHKKKNLYKFST